MNHRRVSCQVCGGGPQPRSKHLLGRLSVLAKGGSRRPLKAALLPQRPRKDIMFIQPFPFIRVPTRLGVGTNLPALCLSMSLTIVYWIEELLYIHIPSCFFFSHLFSVNRIRRSSPFGDLPVLGLMIPVGKH